MRCPLCDSYAVRRHQRPSEKNNFRSRYYCTSCKKYFSISPEWTLVRRKTPHLSLNATKIWQQYVFEWLSFEHIAELHGASLNSTINAFLQKNKDETFTHTFYNRRIYKRTPCASQPLYEVERPIKKPHEIGVPHFCPVCFEGTLDHYLWVHTETTHTFPHYRCNNPQCASSFFELPIIHPIPDVLIPYIIKLFNESHMNVHHISRNLWLQMSDVRNLLKEENGKYPASR